MNVICFGDSNTYGFDPRSWFGGRYEPDSRWGDLLAGRTGWHIRNEGENGREIPTGQICFPGDADLLILMLGTNDLLMGHSAKETGQEMEAFLQNMRIPMERIVVLSPPAMIRGTWVPEESLIQESKALACYYRSLCDHIGIRFVNASDWKIPLCHDGVHMTEAGNRIFADHLYKELIK